MKPIGEHRWKSVVWGGDDITWENASDTTKEKFALDRLFWFYRLCDHYELLTGEKFDDLDREVVAQAKEAAQWYGPRLKGQAEKANQEAK